MSKRSFEDIVLERVSESFLFFMGTLVLLTALSIVAIIMTVVLYGAPLILLLGWWIYTVNKKKDEDG